MPILAAPVPNRHQATIDGIFSIPADVTRERLRRDLTLTETAAQIGIGRDTLTRLLAPGSQPTQPTIVSALRWLAS